MVVVCAGAAVVSCLREAGMLWSLLPNSQSWHSTPPYSSSCDFGNSVLSATRTAPDSKMGPQVIQHPLVRADGSTVFSDGLYTVIAGVNGPVDVQRRDELPEEAAIEVNLRPTAGVGGPRERWLETVVASVLKSILLVHMHPRTLIQVTLQVTKEPTMKFRKTPTDISTLPALLNAAFLALADGGLPLATTTSAVLAAVDVEGEIIVAPDEKTIKSSRSIHALAFDKDGEQLLDQSAGKFDLNTWSKVVDAAQQTCASAVATTGEDAAMANGVAQGEPWLRQTLQDQAATASAWRGKT